MKISIKNLAKILFVGLYPMPWNLAHKGYGSVIMFPRKLEGVRAISIGSNTIAVGGAWISAYHKYLGRKYQPTISIGNDVRIGRNFMLTAIDEVCIGDGCLLSGDIYISDHTHGYIPCDIPPASQPLVPKGPVRLGRNCFIGIRVSIMPGVILGNYCVVGAHSVVTKSFPDGSVIAGAPARLIRTLPLPLDQIQLNNNE